MRKVVISLLLIAFLCSCGGPDASPQAPTAITDIPESQTLYEFRNPIEETENQSCITDIPEPTPEKATVPTTQIHTVAKKTVKFTVKQTAVPTARPTAAKTTAKATEAVNTTVITTAATKLTEKATVPTTKPTEKASVPVAKPTEKATVSATTAPVTASEPATTVPVTTVPAETQAARKWSIVIGTDKIEFGITPEQLNAAMGIPSEIINEQSTDGKQYASCVYASDYSKMSVFQFCDGILGGFYTVNPGAILTDGFDSFSIRAYSQASYENLNIDVFKDGIGNGMIYAFHIRHNGFKYTTSMFSDFAGQEKLVFHTTNALRALNGLPALSYCEKAAKSASLHSRDMVTNDFFDHQAPDGSGPFDRMRAQGIFCSIAAENIAAGYISPFDFADGWYNSAGHRSNMLDSRITRIGVGITVDSDSRAYGTQNFYG